jgi:hypothetical protein
VGGRRSRDRWRSAEAQGSRGTVNEVSLEHEHADDRRPMELVRVERVDGLTVQHYVCGCGHTVVVLGRVEGQEQGMSWPLRWLVAPESPPD